MLPGMLCTWHASDSTGRGRLCPILEICERLLVGTEEDALCGVLVQHADVALLEPVCDVGMVAGNLLAQLQAHFCQHPGDWGHLKVVAFAQRAVCLPGTLALDSFA